MPTTNPQRTPVVQEVYPASGAHYAAPGVREAYEQYGIPPIMYQRDPYATAAFRTYVDPYGQMSVQPLIGFPSRYPHVVSGVPTDSLARAMSVAGPFMAAPISAPPAAPAKTGGTAPARRSPASQAPARSAPAAPAPARPAMAPSHEPYVPPSGRDRLKLSGELQPFPIAAPEPYPYIDGGAPYDTSGMDAQYGALIEQALLHAASPEANQVLASRTTPVETPTYSPDSIWSGLGRFAARVDSTLRDALGMSPAAAAQTTTPVVPQAPGMSSPAPGIQVSPALQRAAAQTFPSPVRGGNGVAYRIEVPPLDAAGSAASASPISVPALTTAPAGGRTTAPAHTYSAGDGAALITPPAPDMAASHMPVAAPAAIPVAPPPVYTGGYQATYPRTPGVAQPIAEQAPANMGEYWSRIQARRMAEERALLPMLYRQLTAPLYTADAAPAQLLPSAVARPAAQQAPAMVPPAVYYPAP